MEPALEAKIKESVTKVSQPSLLKPATYRQIIIR